MSFSTLQESMHDVQKDEHSMDAIAAANIKAFGEILAMQLRARPPILRPIPSFFGRKKRNYKF